MSVLDSALWSLGALVAYAAIAFRVGDSFPFSQYSMYARLRGRTEGATIYVKAAGQVVAPQRLERFVGLDIERVSPKGFPTSQEWITWEVRRWIEEHVADACDADAVPVEVGFRMVSIERFVLKERDVAVTRGFAHWRAR